MKSSAENIVIKALLGFVFLFPIIFVPSPTMADYVRIRGTVVNVREGPGTTFPVLFQAEQGYEFDLLRTEGLWCLVRLDQEKEAWVFGRLVEIMPGERSTENAQEVEQGEEEGLSSLWARHLDTILIGLIILFTLIVIRKRGRLLTFTQRKLKEISGYRREQPFRYDNRKPKDDSWEL
jgi:hypothetical protein